MRAGAASETARRVAAHRLSFERAPAPFGDPAADEQLARDVAGSVRVGSSPMRAYLEARTRFFDRVVLGAIDGDVGQVVVGAAGYDGRALRYASPGVRWFEVDHPDTQRDKRARLDRLGIETPHVSFVAADFEVDPIAQGLLDAGLEPSAPSLFLLEGVVVYLERHVVERVLRELREVAALRSRLAVSFSVEADASPGRSARRAAFRAAVAGLGEPARTHVSAAEVPALLASTGWREARAEPGSAAGRARRAGLVVASSA